jgi:hypothetical protein
MRNLLACITALAAVVASAKAGETERVEIAPRVVLVNEASGQILAVSGASVADGANVFQFRDLDQQDARWAVETVKRTEEAKETKGAEETDSSFLDARLVRLRNLKSGKYLTVAAGLRRDGANVVQWRDLDLAEMVWERRRHGPECYELRNRRSGKLLTVNRGALHAGANVVQWSELDEDPQPERAGRAAQTWCFRDE